MGDTITPAFDISRKQISDFVKDPRTIRDVEALARMLREQVPTALTGKVDNTLVVIAGAGLTGGGDLTADVTFDIGAGTGMIVNADDIAIDLVAEAERIRDVIGAALTDTATIDFTADDPGDKITADLKNTTVTPNTYGDATHVGQFTVDQQGRLTAASSIAITFPSVSSGGGLVATNNLSDVSSPSTALTNLGGRAAAPNVQAVTSAATVTPTFSNDLVKITAQAAALTLANPTGSAVPGWGMGIRIKDNGTARAISYGTQYRAIGVTLPTTTVISKTLYLAMIYNSDDTKWDVLAVAQEA